MERHPEGLSPLARGNQPPVAIRGGFFGPIPARAGQPATGGRAPARCRAYPRSRGATWYCRAHHKQTEGLSPLARGNRNDAKHGAAWYGPIPARAGQPPLRRLRKRWLWAYPRSRGATVIVSGRQLCHGGLSPLARGNPGLAADSPAVEGPIPARAGQPTARRVKTHSPRAYPRSRGATT